MSIFNFFKNLPGTWHYTRTLTHRISGYSLGSAEGVVAFSSIYTPDENTNIIHYKEEGIFINISKKEITAHQEYLYIYKKQTNTIEKHFTKDGIDTGLFYILNFEDADSGASGSHLCIKDYYQAKYQFLSFSKFELKYTVIGPSKNYISTTLFTNKLFYNEPPSSFL